MKYFSLTFTLLFCSLLCHAQETKQQTYKWKSNNDIKTDLIGYLHVSAYFSYERVITDSISVMVTYGQGQYSITDKDAEDNLLQKLGRSFPCGQMVELKSYISIEGRQYLPFSLHSIPAGFHIGPSFVYAKGSETFGSSKDMSSYLGVNNHIGPISEKVTTEYKSLSFMVNCGPQLLINRLIAFDVSIGLGFRSTSGTEIDVYSDPQFPGSTSEFSYGEFAVAFSASLGIAFGK